MNSIQSNPSMDPLAGEGQSSHGPESTTAGHDIYPVPFEAWSAVIILSAFYFLSMIDRLTITLLQGSIKTSLGITDVELSLLYGAIFAIPYAVMSFAAGWAVDRFSRRKVVFWSVMLWSTASAASGLARSFGSLAAARGGVGAGEAGITPAAHSILADSFRPEKLSLPISIYALGSKTGQASSLLIGGLIAVWILPGQVYHLLGTDVWGWQLIFLIVGIPGMAMAFAIFLIKEPVRHAMNASGSTIREQFRFIGRHRRFFVTHHAGTLLLGATSVGINSWAPAYFERVFGLTPAEVGGLLGIALLIGPLAGLPLHGYITDRLYKRGMKDAHLRYLMICVIAAIPFGVATFLVGSPIIAAVCLCVFAMLLSGYLSLPACSLQLVVPGALRGKSSATLMLIAGQGALIFGASVIAMITDYGFGDTQRVGDSIVIAILLFLPLASVLFLLCLKPLRTMQQPVGQNGAQC